MIRYNQQTQAVMDAVWNTADTCARIAETRRCLCHTADNPQGARHVARCPHAIAAEIRRTFNLPLTSQEEGS